LKIINQLGYVQIDTISVVNRAHHHVLWSRFPDYNEDSLHQLQSSHRSVFEYWGHAMSYLPMSDYRYYLHRMERFKKPSSPWAKYQLGKTQHLLEPVLKRITEEGPLSAKDFPHNQKKGGNWWDWKPAKVALEMLFWQGELMITERRKFQKVYDLRERVLPDKIDTRMPARSEVFNFIIRRGLQAMVVATEHELFRFLQPGNSRDSDVQSATREEIHTGLHQLIEKGEVVPVQLTNNSGHISYALKNVLNQSVCGSPEKTFLKILSPFDNLIIQRERTVRLFNFDYSLECYMPVKKRKYGYFVMPIIWNGRFSGRLDPKADRKNNVLHIKSLHLEPDFEPHESFLKQLALQLSQFAGFNKCETVALEKIEPAKLRQPLNNFLKGNM
jgi:uncharacterized protein YcaQ